MALGLKEDWKAFPARVKARLVGWTIVDLIVIGASLWDVTADYLVWPRWMMIIAIVGLLASVIDWLVQRKVQSKHSANSPTSQVSPSTAYQSTRRDGANTTSTYELKHHSGQID